MQQLILVLHVLVAICLIGLVLMQHGKGADMGAAFGSGSANTMFGSSGPAPFLMKITALLALIFFITSLTLNYLVAQERKQASSLNTMNSSLPIQSVPNSSGSPSQRPQPKQMTTTKTGTDQNNVPSKTSKD